MTTPVNYLTTFTPIFKNNKNSKRNKKTKQIKDPLLIMLIASRHRAQSARAAIRATWATITRNNTNLSNVRYVFIFGTSIDPVLNDLGHSAYQDEILT